MQGFEYDIWPVPGQLRPLGPEIEKDGQTFLERLEKACAPEALEVIKGRDDLLYILSISDFIAKTMIQYPAQSAELIGAGAVDSAEFSLDPREAVESFIAEGLPDPELKKRLRILRRTRMVPIAWRDLTGRAEIEEVFTALTSLAECIVLRTLKVVRSSMARVFGDALDRDGRPMPLLILGMGKLGGGELNFSSDIDLIFAYPYDGQTQGGQRSITHQEFFTRVVQKLSNLLSENNADGFCYRIDLRLRPFGDAGPLVSCFDALAIYYETQGRTWERYALVKARILGNGEEWGGYGEELMELLRPFVYRRYLDFGAIESLRKLKLMIAAEVRRRRLIGNFKLGRGGIREVEFISQVFALMRGGRIPELAERSLRKSFVNLAKLELLPKEICTRLDHCYVYLRRLENVIQEFSDVQTQNLPEDEKQQRKLACAMNKDNYQELVEELSGVMETVHDEFAHVIHDESDDKDEEEEPEGPVLWGSMVKADDLREDLEDIMEYPEDAADYAHNIIALRDDLAKQPVGPVGRETLVQLMPKLIRLIGQQKNAPKLFNLVASLIDRIALRTTYLQLLQENSQACRRLVDLFNENRFASALISSHPVLLDELIAPRYFTKPPSTAEYSARLHEQMMRIEPDDLEGQMETLRLFKQTMIFRIAMSDRAHALPLMQVSDSLTYLAEALVGMVAQLSWNYSCQRFGCPEGTSSDNPGFAIIGYGKFGGLELGYKSDLDMVFIRQGTDGQTDGPSPISNVMFYQRLVQRLMHLITTRMSGGVLYDMDMRLRPDGDSGLLITDSEGFDSYQSTRAWTWEHQALVRARPIYGSKEVIEAFRATREKVLRAPRDEDKLKADVLMMRDKMRRHLDKSSDKVFDLKEGLGAMVDIEFIAQYLLLRDASKYPDMVLWTDNVHIFDECERLGILSSQDCSVLTGAYLAVRGLYHRLSLADQQRIILQPDVPGICADATEIWHKIFD